MKQTFKKQERLHGTKAIEQLFSQGTSFFLHPFVVYYQWMSVVDSQPVCSVLFSVSKKKIRHATQRNLLKRRMREAFRKNKHILYKTPPLQTNNLHLAFVYIKREIADYALIERKMVEAIKGCIPRHAGGGECCFLPRLHPSV